MRKLYILLVFILIVFISSCSAMKNESNMDDATDGVPFEPEISYIIDNVKYDAYLPVEYSDAAYYEYEIGNVVSSSVEWTVNFIYDVNYHVKMEKETVDVWKALYSNLLDSKEILDKRCGYSTKLFDPFLDIELEYTLHNETSKEALYVIFYTFLPVRLVNNYTKERYTVGIPINVDVLLKVEDRVQNPFNKNEMISWEDFLAI